MIKIEKIERPVDTTPYSKPSYEPSDPSDPQADPRADPEYKRKEAVKDARHRNVLFFHRLFPIVTIMGLLLLLIMLFVILPMSEIELEFVSVLGALRNYSKAFVTANSTILIALATIIVSDVLKHFYRFVKMHVKDEETNT